MIKAKVREVSQQYSRFVQRERKANENSNQNKLIILEKSLLENPTDISLINKINDIKKQIEINLIAETKAASIRAGVKWIESGEKIINTF